MMVEMDRPFVWPEEPKDFSEYVLFSISGHFYIFGGEVICVVGGGSQGGDCSKDMIRMEVWNIQRLIVRYL